MIGAIRQAIGGAAIAVLAFSAPQIASAQGLLRDAEIESTLDRLMQPLMTAGAVPANSVNLYIVNDSSLNAFVAGGRNVFINSGLVMRLERADMLQAVLAHELGHITGGHLARRNAALRAGQGVAAIGLLVAIAAAAAGSGSGTAAAVAGSQQLAQRGILAHSRSEESGADQAAIGYLERAGIDPGAMLDVLEIFRGQQALAIGRADPYVLTHPLSQERIRLLEGRAATSPAREAEVPDDIAYWYARTRAKFTGFLSSTRTTFREYPEEDTSEPALLARAIAYARVPDLSRANETLDALIARRPNDAFYHELKGELLLETNQAASAVGPYRRAVALAPNEPLILSGLGRALLAQNSAEADREALTILERARGLDSADPASLRGLATAYHRADQPGNASLVTAERYALLGRFEDAEPHARRAEALLPNGSPGWLRAQDILAVAERR
ncbi:MAG: M48 family metalloprotease [Pseudomonadota bacterium]